MRIPLSDNPAADLQNGSTFFGVGLYEGAVEYLEHCLSNDPENIRARYLLALTRFRLHQDFFAVPEFNRLNCSPDPEAQLAAQMLRRAFRLYDGDPLHDVVRLSKEEARSVIAWTAELPLEPIPFAGLTWSCPWGGDRITHVDLSTLYGPEYRIYCTMPADQSPLIPDVESDWVPVWSCSARVFDRMTAMHLFFQRAMLYWRYEFHFHQRPIHSHCEEFSRATRDILIERVYGGHNTTVEDEQGWLFPELPWLPDDFYKEW